MTQEDFFMGTFVISFTFFVLFVFALVGKMLNVREMLIFFDKKEPEDIGSELWLYPVLSVACWFVYFLFVSVLAWFHVDRPVLPR